MRSAGFRDVRPICAPALGYRAVLRLFRLFVPASLQDALEEAETWYMDQTGCLRAVLILPVSGVSGLWRELNKA